MKHYVGLDVSMEETMVCVMEGSGEGRCGRFGRHNATAAAPHNVTVRSPLLESAFRYTRYQKKFS